MSASHSDSSTFVIGLGNVLCGDDAAGVAALHRLARRYWIPDAVTLIDGGTLGLSLLPYVADAKQLLILDAVLAAAPSGSVLRLEGDDAGRAIQERLSVHQVGVADLIDAARLIARYPSQIVLLGIVAEAIELGLGRSEPVEAGIDALVLAAVDELERLGIPRLVERTSTQQAAAPLARAGIVLGL